ncbi:hypothetical protein EDD80_10888 [Anseongella ginsenosidimutans]|uniref:Uncharacterized protein n=1 Tax=Anseongella ginsenosidimutans TaxID=496056 RepID=A0A4R3KNZ1_9SPHI|nr:hypothetical protein EDD80_10888 [Anseongella ginsenosidimutans]
MVFCFLVIYFLIFQTAKKALAINPSIGKGLRNR